MRRVAACLILIRSSLNPTLFMVDAANYEEQVNKWSSLLKRKLHFNVIKLHKIPEQVHKYF